MVQLCDERTQLLKILRVEAEGVRLWRILRSAAWAKRLQFVAHLAPTDWCVSRCRGQQIGHLPARSSSSGGRPPSSLKTDHMNQAFNLNMYSRIAICDFLPRLCGPCLFRPQLLQHAGQGAVSGLPIKLETSKLCSMHTEPTSPLNW
jgi:hypothetical protein